MLAKISAVMAWRRVAGARAVLGVLGKTSHLKFISLRGGSHYPSSKSELSSGFNRFQGKNKQGTNLVIGRSGDP
jgi:hypothetical protein